MKPYRTRGAAPLEDQYRRLLSRYQSIEREVEHLTTAKAIDDADRRIAAEKLQIKEEMDRLSREIRALAGSKWDPSKVKPLHERPFYRSGHEAAKVLRAHGGEMTTHEVARALAVRFGEDFDDPETRKKLVHNVRAFFTSAALEGSVRSEGSPARWSIVPRVALPDRRDFANILPSPISYASWLRAQKGS